MSTGRPAPVQNGLERGERASDGLFLSTADFDLETPLLQCADQGLALVALDLDDAVLDGASCSAPFLELAGQFSQIIGGSRDAGHEGYGLPLSPAPGAADSDDSVCLGRGGGCLLLVSLRAATAA